MSSRVESATTCAPGKRTVAKSAHLAVTSPVKNRSNPVEIVVCGDESAQIVAGGQSGVPANLKGSVNRVPKTHANARLTVPSKSEPVMKRASGPNSANAVRVDNADQVLPRSVPVALAFARQCSDGCIWAPWGACGNEVSAQPVKSRGSVWRRSGRMCAWCLGENM